VVGGVGLAIWFAGKAGKTTPVLTVTVLVIILALCLCGVYLIPWLWSSENIVEKIWRVSSVTTVVLILVAKFGIWVWPSIPAPTAKQESSPKQAQPSVTTPQPDALPPNPTNFTFSSDKPLIRGVRATKKMMALDVDTSVLKLAARDFWLIIVLRVQDDSVDALTDSRILKSAAFAITGEVRAVQVDLPADFVKRAEEIGGKVGHMSIQVYIGVIPKHIRPEQILTITDITALGGKQLIVSSPATSKD